MVTIAGCPAKSQCAGVLPAAALAKVRVFYLLTDPHILLLIWKVQAGQACALTKKSCRLFQLQADHPQKMPAGEKVPESGTQLFAALYPTASFNNDAARMYQRKFLCSDATVHRHIKR